MRLIRLFPWLRSAPGFCVFLLLVISFGNIAASAEPGIPHIWGYFSLEGKPARLNDLKAVGAAQYYALGLKENGTVVGWGSAQQGQLNIPAGLSNVVAISAGYYTPMVLTGDGKVHVWAAGHVHGQKVLNVPSEATNIIKIASGAYHCLALRSDGKVLAWGGNNFGEINVPASLSDIVDVAAGQSYSLAISSSGKVTAWGNQDFYGTVPSSATNITSVAVSNFGFAVGLRKDGTVVTWGKNEHGQRNLPFGFGEVIAMAAGDSHTVFIKSDGSVAAFGKNEHGQARPPAGKLRGFAVAAGAASNIMLSKAPNIEQIVLPTIWPIAGDDFPFNALVSQLEPATYYWARNGALVHTGMEPLFVATNIQESATGTYSLVASNAFGFTASIPIDVQVQASAPRILSQSQHQAIKPGFPAEFSAIVRGTDPITYQWLHNGTNLPGATLSFLSIPEVSADHEGEYVLKITNAYGSRSTDPVLLSSLKPIIIKEPISLNAPAGWNLNLEVEAISSVPATYQWFHNGNPLASATHSKLEFAPVNIEDTGEYWVEVRNDYGTITSRHVFVDQLARTNSATEGMLPVFWAQGAHWLNPPEKVTNLVQVSTGLLHALGLEPNGNLVTWGNEGDLGLLTIPTAATNVLTIHSGAAHNLVIRKDGTVIGWGKPGENYGQWIIPPEATNIIEVAPAIQHSLFLRADGKPIISSHFHIPEGLSNIVDVAADGAFNYVVTAQGQVHYWTVAWTNTPLPKLLTAIGLDGVLSGAPGGLFLRKDGTVAQLDHWNPEGGWKLIEGISNAVQVSESVVLLANGEVRTFGFEFPAPPAGLKARVVSSIRTQIIALTQSPSIDEQPMEELVLNLGGGAELKAKGRSATPFTYQWYKDAQLLDGETNSSLSFKDASYMMQGEYLVTVSNAYDSVSSRICRILVQGPPLITGMDAPSTVLDGDNVRLSLQFEGNPTPSVQWYWNGFRIIHGTNATLVLPSANSSINGEYFAILSNAFGTDKSESVYLDVRQLAPQIETKPFGGGTIPEGNDLRLFIEAKGSPMLQYQWFLNDQILPVQTNSVLLIPSVTATQGGEYWVEVSNSLGKAASQKVAVEVTRSAPAPEIIRPTRVTRQGRNVVFNAIARGSGLSKVQWLHDGQELPGQTNLVLVIPNTQLTNSGNYSLRATNEVGEKTSSEVYLTVLASHSPGVLHAYGPLSSGVPQANLVEAVSAGRHGLALLPEGRVIGWGQNAFGQASPPPSLTNVVAISAGSLSSLALTSEGKVVGWGYNESGQATPPEDLEDVVAISAGPEHSIALKRNGELVTWGRTNLTSIPFEISFPHSIEASWQYSLVALSNGLVKAWGDNSLSVRSITNIPPSITNIVEVAGAQRFALALDRDGNVKLWGNGPVKPLEATNIIHIDTGNGHAVALRKDGRLIAWGTDNLGSVRTANGLTNIASISAGENNTLAISYEPIILKLNLPPTTLAQGTPFNLEAIAIGSGELQFQWFHNNQPIVGANSSTLAIPSFQKTNQGTYSLELRNAYGTRKTAGISFAIGLPPLIAKNPTNVVALAGSNARFEVVAQGVAPFSYQWMLNGTNLYSATGSILVLTNVISQDQGKVAVRVSNLYGDTFSEATLTVRSRAPVAPAFSEHLVKTSIPVFKIKVQPYFDYQTLTSTNLVDWVVIQSFTAKADIHEISYPGSSTNEPQRFFKVVSP